MVCILSARVVRKQASSLSWRGGQTQETIRQPQAAQETLPGGRVLGELGCQELLKPHPGGYGKPDQQAGPGLSDAAFFLS